MKQRVASWSLQTEGLGWVERLHRDQDTAGLPTSRTRRRKHLIVVNRSPHGHKKHRDQFATWSSRRVVVGPVVWGDRSPRREGSRATYRWSVRR